MKFGKTVQVSTPDHFANMQSGQHFSMVYAPYEGRFVSYIPDKKQIWWLKWKDGKHQMRYMPLMGDDFEIDEPVITLEVEKNIAFLSEIAADLSMCVHNNAATIHLVRLKHWSQSLGMNDIGVELAATAMDFRRNLINGGLKSAGLS
jgi:hypothetical protein